MKVYAATITAAFLALLWLSVLHQCPTPRPPIRTATQDSAAVYRDRLASMREDSASRSVALSASLQRATRAGQRAKWLSIRLDSLRKVLEASGGVDSMFVPSDTVCPDAAPALVALGRCADGLAIAKQQIRIDSIDLNGIQTQAGYDIEEAQRAGFFRSVAAGVGGVAAGVILVLFSKY